MTKITAGLLITLDGVIEAPEKWNPPYDNDEMTQVVMEQMADADTQLYGRRTYESFRTVFTGPSAPPRASLLVHPVHGRHRQAPVRGRHRPGAAHAPRIQATQQRCRRAPLRPRHLATRPGTHTTTGDLEPSGST